MIDINACSRFWLLVGLFALALIADLTSVHAEEPKTLGRVISHEVEGNDVFLHCENGGVVLLSVLADDLIRFRVSPNGTFNESKMIRWGYVNDDWPEIAFEVEESHHRLSIETQSVKVVVSMTHFSFDIFDHNGTAILSSSRERAVSCGTSNTLKLQMPANEHFFGFGFMRSAFDARGKAVTWKRGYRWKEATVPFYMSTRGYGFYSNNTWDHHFDFSATTNSLEQNGEYEVTCDGGQIDFYLIYGPTFRNILHRYADLTGHSQLVPRWALGPQYRARYLEDQEGLLEIARTYREKEIPCEIMALEPGWEETHYSMAWKWSPERFPKPQGMIQELKRLGYQLDLWESGIAPYQDLTDPEIRKQWYDRRRDIVDQGVRMFKQDDPYPRSIKSTELLEARFADEEIIDSNCDPRELINISNTLYTDTLFEQFRQQTDQRPVVMFHAYNASVASHRWPFQWAGDFQAGNGMLSASLSGHAMVSFDIRNPYPSGWHQGFFTPFTVVDSWAYYREPWRYSHAIEESHRRYACLRSRLMPYLYTSMWQAHCDGLPMMRPMVLDYTQDENTFELTSQYMLGDWLLVGLTADEDQPQDETVDYWTGEEGNRHGKIYLPKGRWVNYWTGEVTHQTKAGWVSGSWPKYMGGMLWVKAGAIIPMGLVKNYTHEVKDEVLVLDIYPHGDSFYTVYEDDGATFEYEQGSYALTEVSCRQQSIAVDIAISRRQGKYDRMPERRTHLLKIHSPTRPLGVSLDGTEMAQAVSAATLAYDSSSHGWYYDEPSKKVIVKVDPGWAYTLRTPEHDPFGTIPPTAKFERIAWSEHTKRQDSPCRLTLALPTKPVVELSANKISIPADGVSQLIVQAELPSKPGFNGSCSITVEGPGYFPGGKQAETVRFYEGKAMIDVVAGERPGTVEITLEGDSIETASLSVPIHGKPSQLQLDANQTVFFAGVDDRAQVSAVLCDAGGRPIATSAYPVRFLKNQRDGTHAVLVEKKVTEGRARTEISSSQLKDTKSVWAECGEVRSEPLDIRSAKGELKVNMNPPELVDLPSGAEWIPNRVSVFVGLYKEGQLALNVDAKVTLELKDANRKTLRTYEKETHCGEVEFTDVSYASREENYYLTISSPGFEPVELRIFENTWND